MSDPVRFSVVMPLFNKERFVQRALRSVLRQTYEPSEIIVVNDGSTDKSRDQALALADARVRIVDQTNQGPGAARNAGVELSHCPLVGFLDADDEWSPEFLEGIERAVRDFAPRMRVGLYTALCFRERHMDRPPAPPRDEGAYHVITSFCAECGETYPVNSSTAVIPRSVFDEVGGFATSQRLKEDVDLWVRIGLRYPMVRVNRALTTVHNDDTRSATKGVAGRPWPLEIDSMCRYFSCSIDQIPKDAERKYAQRALYNFCLSMIRHGRIEAFDENVGRSRFDLKKRLLLKALRRLHVLVPKKKA